MTANANTKQAFDGAGAITALLRAMVRVSLPETDGDGNPNLTRFFLEKGRLPFARDSVKPWEYRGWNVPYLQLAEIHPQVAPRYDYVQRTLEQGSLLDENLPHQFFVGESSQEARKGLKHLEKLVDICSYRSHSWNAFRDVCEWMAFGLGATNQPSKLGNDIQEQLYRTFNLEYFMLAPTDYLGQFLAESGHGKKSGYFPTPMHVVEMMTAMTFPATGDSRSALVSDPCGGSGRMLLYASNFSLRLFGMDIDPLCCLISKINLALYAPWFYIPDSFYPKRIVEHSEPEKIEPAPRNEPKSANEPETETLFEKLRKEKKELKKKKQFTTKIDQPTLFGLD
jgi:hypothetical protein